MNKPTHSAADDQPKGADDQAKGTANEQSKGTEDKAKGAANDDAKGAADKAKDLVGKAQHALTDGTMADLIEKVPASLKETSGKAVDGFKTLTTTQKVVGGSLLALALTYLVSPSKSSAKKKKKKNKEQDKKDKKKAKAASKAKSKSIVSVLDELLLFVNDRIEGYKRAVDETKDDDLKSYYNKLVGQSKDFSKDLNDYLAKHGGERETGTTLKGKLYRKLMDAQALVMNRDEKSILAANIFGERYAIRAYKSALKSDVLKGSIRDAVKKQFSQSKDTFQKMQKLTAKQD